jgi:hypothetical protein
MMGMMLWWRGREGGKGVKRWVAGCACFVDRFFVWSLRCRRDGDIRMRT